MDLKESAATAVKTIKGYAYGNKITREDLMAVLYLARDMNAREMFKHLASEGFIELIKGEPRFPDKDDEYKITEKGFELIGEP